jgi:uncharacterized protein YjbJ (UPF0337 family)
MESKMINRDQAAGTMNQGAGQVKEALGYGVGSEQLVAEGTEQKYRGGIQKAVGDVKEAGKDVYDAAKDAAKPQR